MAPKETQVPKNKDTSINYVSTRDIWDRNNIIVENIFAFTVALEITRSNEDLEPHTIEECQCRYDWPKWKEAIHVKFDSLVKHKVFEPVVQTS